MQAFKVESVGANFKYNWPTTTEVFDHYIDYRVIAEDGDHIVRIGFCRRKVYAKERMRVVVWIDNHSHTEFAGADDFEKSGEVLSEIRLPSKGSTKMCRYPDDVIHERYRLFNVVGIPNRIKATGVHNAWSVVVNIADHKSMIALAGLRMLEKKN